ncbi:ATP-binding protein [Paenibacillus sp. sgz5001063]|uniref:ATP-binding protein n=1 Tax=Paenibacillus sp. sgz5001063 TaxID=3242474 RepID=UPI0036D3B6CC
MNKLNDRTYGQILVIHTRSDIALAMETTRRIALLTEFSEHESILLQLVTEEACMNAFEHGCPSGNCEFRVSWLVESDIMEIRVCQNGESFELENEQAQPVKIGSRGRGLVLIQGIMDEVRLIPTGPYITLSMRKKRKV